jgi:hypothetical protein
LHAKPQAPDWQTAWALVTLVEHVRPQPLQLLGSLMVSTHVPEQGVGVPAGQPPTHVEFEQMGVAPLQAWAHVPQLP